MRRLPLLVLLLLGGCREALVDFGWFRGGIGEPCNHDGSCDAPGLVCTRVKNEFTEPYRCVPR